MEDNLFNGLLALQSVLGKQSYQPDVIIAPQRELSRMRRALKRHRLQWRGRHYLRRLARGKPPKKRRRRWT